MATNLAIPPLPQLTENVDKTKAAFVAAKPGQHCEGFSFHFECAAKHSFCPGCYRPGRAAGTVFCPTCGELIHFATCPTSEMMMGN